MSTRIASVVIALVLVAIALPASANGPWPGTGFAEGFIFIDSYADSNATNIPIVGDVLSGDLTANLQYRGISDRGWLGHHLDTPGEACRGEVQGTGSMWYEVEPLNPVDPPAGAISAGHSVIAKDDGDVSLQMEIDIIVWDAETEMGYRPTGRASVLSRFGVLELTYRLTNVGEQPVLDLHFYQYLHPHPNGSCWDLPDDSPGHTAQEIYGAYDPKLYKLDAHNFPASQDYRFDLTFWAPDLEVDGDFWPGSTVGISTLESPSMWGIGEVGEVPVPGEPVPAGFCDDNPDLIWCQVENDDLPTPMATSAGPGHFGGALGWQLPRLNDGHSVERHVLFAVADLRP
jgi:hypothetical protein